MLHLITSERKKDKSLSLELSEVKIKPQSMITYRRKKSLYDLINLTFVRIHRFLTFFTGSTIIRKEQKCLCQEITSFSCRGFFLYAYLVSESHTRFFSWMLNASDGISPEWASQNLLHIHIIALLYVQEVVTHCI